MKRILKALVIVIILALAVSVEREVEISEPCSMPQPLIYDTKEYPDDLMMTSVKDNGDKDLLNALFSGLVKKDAEGKVVPCLCESFSVSDDGIEYKFILRDDIYYSNGEKITASDYKNFLCQFLSDKENVYAKDLDSIYGVPSFRSGESGFDSVAVNAADDRTLVIRLNEPDAKLLDILSNPVFGIRDYDSLGNYKEDYKNIRYTGPFVIKDIDAEGITIAKNKSYYDKSITDEAIRFTCCKDKAEALARLEEDITSDSIDIVKDVPSNEVSRLSDNGNLKTYDCGNHYFIMVGPQLQTDDFAQLRNRLAECIDRDRYMAELSEGFIKKEYAENSDESKAVFSANVGEESSNSGSLELSKPLRMIYKADSISRYISGRLAEEIREKLQLDVDELQCSSTDFENRKENGEYEILIDNYSEIYGYDGEFYVNAINNNEYVLPVIIENSTVASREGIEGASVTSCGIINLEKVQRIEEK